MIVIGITGGMGTGKTTVAKMFGRLGAKLIDADRIAHQVMKPEGNGWKKVVGVFGKGILDENNRINRKKLADIVFIKHPEKLRDLNAIIHPKVIEAIFGKIDRAKREKAHVVVVDAPLLIEAGLEPAVDKLVVVTAARERQKERIRAKSQLANVDIEARISSQLPLEEKENKADYVVDNNGQLKETWEQVRKIWGEIK